MPDKRETFSHSLGYQQPGRRLLYRYRKILGHSMRSKTWPMQLGSVRDFVHEPLDQTTKSIRLLRILLGRRKAPIRCEFEHSSVESDYVCLSYMWGSDNPSNVILFNGPRLRVRQNLFDFLAIARRLDIKDWLWIDAIYVHLCRTRQRRDRIEQSGDGCG